MHIGKPLDTVSPVASTSETPVFLNKNNTNQFTQCAGSLLNFKKEFVPEVKSLNTFFSASNTLNLDDCNNSATTVCDMPAVHDDCLKNLNSAACVNPSVIDSMPIDVCLKVDVHVNVIDSIPDKCVLVNVNDSPEIGRAHV